MLLVVKQAVQALLASSDGAVFRCGAVLLAERLHRVRLHIRPQCVI
jgi:hypothetical protein